MYILNYPGAKAWRFLSGGVSLTHAHRYLHLVCMYVRLGRLVGPRRLSVKAENLGVWDDTKSNRSRGTEPSQSTPTICQLPTIISYGQRASLSERQSINQCKADTSTQRNFTLTRRNSPHERPCAIPKPSWPFDLPSLLHRCNRQATVSSSGHSRPLVLGPVKRQVPEPPIGNPPADRTATASAPAPRGPGFCAILFLFPTACPCLLVNVTRS